MALYQEPGVEAEEPWHKWPVEEHREASAYTQRAHGAMRDKDARTYRMYVLHLAAHGEDKLITKTAILNK